MVDIGYVTSDAGIVLSPEQQSMAVQAVSIFRDLYNWTDADTEADNIDALVAETIYALTQSTVPPKEDMNSHILLLPDMASVTSGGTPAWTVDAASSLGGYWIVNPALTSDSMFWQFFLAAGKYDIDMTYLRNTVNGKGDLKIYDVSNNLIATVSLDLRGAVQRNTVGGGSFDNPVSGRIKVEWLGTGTTGASFFRSIQRIVIDKYAEL